MPSEDSDNKIEVSKDIIAYLDKIDEMYDICKAKRLSRFSTEWGLWSTGFNREIRSIIVKKQHPQILLLKSILPYWIVTSELLELHFKSKIHGESKKRKLGKDRKNIKNDIMGGNSISELSIHDIMKLSLNRG